MADLISRKAAIDALKRQRTAEQCKLGDVRNAVVEWCINAIVKLPPEGRERSKGEWLPSAQPPVLTCDGCRHVGTYDTDFPCSGCIRREKDYYEQEHYYEQER